MELINIFNQAKEQYSKYLLDNQQHIIRLSLTYIKKGLLKNRDQPIFQIDLTDYEVCNNIDENTFNLLLQELLDQGIPVRGKFFIGDQREPKMAVISIPLT